MTRKGKPDRGEGSVRRPNGGAGLRSARRYPIDMTTSVRCHDWETAEQIAISNVSRGGMFLRTGRPVAVGSKVKLSLELPDGRELHLVATVAHEVTPEASARTGRPAGVGIEVDEAFRNELRALVEIARIRRDRPASPVDQPIMPSLSSPGFPAILPKDLAAEVIGIDLGVTYSSVSVTTGQETHLLGDEQNRTQIPSVVHLPPGGAPLVGWEARQAQESRPDRTVSSIKRLLGRSHSDPQIAGFLQSAPYRTSAGPNDSIAIEIDQPPLSVPEVCALVLGHLRGMAEQRLERPVRKAVLTYPVTFREPQQQALIRAAQLAGLEVVELLEEPVAGALAYGYGRGKNEIIAVYDFGGGTFDFTVLDMSGNQYRVLVTDGDAWLGGDDFDLALADAVANAFWRQTQIELRDRVVEHQRLLLACERAKRLLSAEEVVRLELPQIVLTPRSTDLVQRIERASFERICAPLFESSLEICSRALDSIGLEPRDVTQVVLSGGTTCAPFVRRGLEQYFDRELSGVVNSFHAVCLGAGLHAARVSRAR